MFNDAHAQVLGGKNTQQVDQQGRFPGAAVGGKADQRNIREFSHLTRISHHVIRPCLSFLRQWARAPSTRATVMLAVAGTHWRKKFGAIIATPDKNSGLTVPPSAPGQPDY